jgi:hypothetical protein
MSAKPIQLLALWVIASLLGTNLNAAAQSANSDQVPAADLKLDDPTILTRRIWLETEWNKFTDGTHTVEETFGQQWAWRMSENQDWAVRLKLPVKIRVGSDVPGFTYLRPFPMMPLTTLTNRPESLSLRSLKRNACSSRYRNK